MTIVRLILAATLIHSAPAALIDVERTLAEMGFVRPERLAGPAPERDFFFPLPSRDFSAGGSSFDVGVEVSPFLDPTSVVTILVNERPVAIRAVGEGGTLTISAPVPADVKADDPTSQVLKLTVRGALALRDGEAASDEIQRATTWIDVLPATKFTCAVDPSDPDWLTATRLPATLGPRVTVRRAGTAEPFVDELALRAVTWAAHAQPFGKVTLSDESPAIGDEIVVDTASDGGAGIRVVGGANGRIVTLSAADAAQADALWDELRGIPLPEDELGVADRKAIRSLDPRVGELNRGPGDTERRFSFAPALLGGSSRGLELALAGRMSDLSGVGQVVGAVFLNDRLIHSAVLDPARQTFSWVVPLPAAQLKGESEVRVAMFPSDRAKAYFWQLEETGEIAAVNGGRGAAGEPPSLVEAAQWAFANGSYDVVLGDGGSLEVAASVVIWLQRVNRATLLDPVMRGTSKGRLPTIVIGDLPAGLSDVAPTLPITSGGGALRLPGEESLGFWQLGFTPEGSPVIVAGSSGPRGPAVLAAVSAQIAGARWIEAGDVVIGDGRSPVLTMNTRERQRPEMPEMVAASGRVEVVAAGPGSVLGEWKDWRWWSVGALWVALSFTILFVYKQGRRHAR